jgi:hypothetical protein
MKRYIKGSQIPAPQIGWYEFEKDTQELTDDMDARYQICQKDLAIRELKLALTETQEKLQKKSQRLKSYLLSTDDLNSNLVEKSKREQKIMAFDKKLKDPVESLRHGRSASNLSGNNIKGSMTLKKTYGKGSEVNILHKIESKTACQNNVSIGDLNSVDNIQKKLTNVQKELNSKKEELMKLKEENNELKDSLALYEKDLLQSHQALDKFNKENLTKSIETYHYKQNITDIMIQFQELSGSVQSCLSHIHNNQLRGKEEFVGNMM